MKATFAMVIMLLLSLNYREPQVNLSVISLSSPWFR